MATDLTTLSKNGQVVIPKSIRDRLGLQPGEQLIATDVEGRIVLTPARSEAVRSEYVAIMRDLDRRLGKGTGRVDTVELVRRLREGRTGERP